MSTENAISEEVKVTSAAPKAASPAPKATAPAPRAPGRADLSARLRARLLEMADKYRAEDALHQAMEIYFSLVRRHDGTREARRARQALIEIAQQHEKDGERRQARSIYEQLL